jgi:hypothetical protein
MTSGYSRDVLDRPQHPFGRLLPCASPPGRRAYRRARGLRVEGSIMAASAQAAPARLPSISEVDRADEKLGSFMSDLDFFASDVAAFVREDVSLEDAAFMARAGIAVEEKCRYTDPATIVRLLVFADETLDDLDRIRDDAQKLRGDLLWAYRECVIEPDGRRKMRDA